MSESMELLIPETAKEMAYRAVAFCNSVESVDIKTPAQFEYAGNLYKELAGYVNALESLRVKTKEPYLLRGREVDAYFKDASAPLENLKIKIDQAVRAYKTAAEQARRAEQARLDAIAAEERRKLEAAAAIQREKEETARREEAAAMERANKAFDEKGRIEALKAAEAARSRADKAASVATSKENKSDVITAPIAVAPEMAKGLTTAANWTMEIKSPLLFVKWAVENNLLHLLEPSSTPCKTYARQTKQEIEYPWGRIFNNERLQSRGMSDYRRPSGSRY